jgi:predicted CxxxxCH...CXXCH cytochrome family protein
MSRTVTMHLASAASLALLALSACDAARPVAPVAAGAGTACTLCHGDSSRSEASALLTAAPPATVSGKPAGAHQAHLHASPFGGAVACSECHVVPKVATHANGTVDLTFGSLATAKGTLATAYAGGTCSNVYCHGASLNAGGTDVAPLWTGPEVGCTSCHGFPPTSHAAAQVQCATCHPGTVKADGTIIVAGGLHINGAVDVQNAHPAGWKDPASHGHAANQDLASCRQCHGADLAGGTSGVSCDACHATSGHAGWKTECTFCHGDAARAANQAAPPLGTQGETQTTDRAVGAHQKHLAGGAIGNAVACTDCHLVPTDIGHVDGAATVTFGAGAKQGGASPTWNGTSCAASYCHGGTLNAGGSKPTPSWTGGPAEAACGACHLVPPASASHSGVSATTNCGNCHTGYDCTTGNLAACKVDKASHIDGNLDVSGLGCTSCHGSATNMAPPAATSSANSAVKIGAHQAHVVKTTLRSAALACAACHTLPTSTTHSNATVELPWGSLARTGTVTPTPGNLGAATSPTQAAWEAAPTCANYCHGAKWTGNAAYLGSAPTPRWTDTAATASACGSCHKAPPTSSAHAGVTGTTNCGTCHTGYSCTTANLAICTVDKASHINGAVDVSGLACNSCHGSAVNNAPPAATSTTNQAVKIGAHQAHVVKSNLRSAALGCADCHTVPTSTTHASGTVDLTWGPLARTGSITPTPGNLGAATSPTQATWEATPTCANYCHGAKWTGNASYLGSAPAPRWTDAAATASTCGSCHKAPPASSAHSSVTATTNCSGCHAGYNCTTGNLAACTVNKATHLNGSLDAPSLTCISCHGSASNYAPPAATSTTNSAVKIGAHQAHVVNSNLRSATLACTECHTMPTSTSHASGTVDMTWGTLAKTGSITPTPGNLGAATSPTQAAWEATPTCANYCHGAKWAGNASYLGSAPAPRWTDTAGTAAACGSCHKAPPGSSAHSSVTATTNCSGCHAGYNCTTGNLAACTVNKATHLNGSLDATGLTCTSCHGSASNNAPPVDTAGLSSGGFRIGAHQKHLTSTTYAAAPVACATCHPAVASYTTSHSNGTRDVAFSGAPNANLRNGAWTASTGSAAGSCASTWCHGAVISPSGGSSGGTLTTPTWTGTISACTACHRMAPSTGQHGNHSSRSCGDCHPGYSTTTVNKATHLNGAKEVGNLVTSWNANTRACVGCHGSDTW